MARVRLNQVQITATAQRQTLPLVRRTTAEILSGARRLAPRGDHVSGSGVPKRSIPLQPSLHSSMSVSSNRIKSEVGSLVKYAATVHQGSQSHVIRSKRGKMLKFRWDRGDFLIAARAGRRGGNKRTGGFHFLARVRHPGNKRPVRYLTTPLILFGRRNGFRVTARPVSRSRLP
jgi:hypothetical protein